MSNESVAKVISAAKSELTSLLPLLNTLLRLSFPLTKESAVLDGPIRRDKLFEMMSCIIRHFTARKVHLVF